MIHENGSHATNLSSIKVVSRQSSVRSIKLKRMSMLDNVFFCAFLCVVGGVATASQGAINAQLGMYTGKGLSSTVVFCLGAWSSANLPLMVSKAPWWAWVGGVLGACFVIITILAVPSLGSGTTTAIIISSKLVFSCFMDHFSWLGIPHRKFTIWRILATIGLIGCVAVIAKF
ncbi:hypothetical protein BG011_000857 [Mortierella polycephala]|uniref:DMT family transporter n=1 Tax=Mortierella polycephala TaxID=41804 RepID=A0A9P6QGQ9_9FUNG|nr:hypothetical protein BG011_000857 [Mortierella polycephala]